MSTELSELILPKKKEYETYFRLIGSLMKEWIKIQEKIDDLVLNHFTRVSTSARLDSNYNSLKQIITSVQTQPRAKISYYNEKGLDYSTIAAEIALPFDEPITIKQCFKFVDRLKSKFQKYSKKYGYDLLLLSLGVAIIQLIALEKKIYASLVQDPVSLVTVMSDTVILV